MLLFEKIFYMFNIMSSLIGVVLITSLVHKLDLIFQFVDVSLNMRTRNMPHNIIILVCPLITIRNISNGCFICYFNCT